MASLGSHNLTMASNAVTLTSTPLTISGGSSIYLCIAVANAKTITAVTDNSGHTYTFVRRIAQSPITSEIWYTDGVIGTGTSYSTNFKVTITASGACDLSLEVCEILGASNPSLESSAASTGTSSTLVTLTGLTTSVPIAFGLMSVAGQNGGTVTFSAVAPSFIIDVTPAPPPISSIQVSGASVGRNLTAPGTYTMSANILGTQNSLKWAAVAVTIKVTCGCDYGCDGVLGSTRVRDCAGVCFNPSSGPPANFADCAGVCNGPSIKDCAGTCYNPNTSNPPHIKGCDGVCGSGKTFDCAGVCGGSGYRDCGGNCINPLTCSSWKRVSTSNLTQNQTLLFISLFFVAVILFWMMTSSRTKIEKSN